MKGKLVTIIAGSVIIGVLFGGVVAASGTKFETNKDTVVVGKSDVIDSAFYGTGQTITIAGTVKGDVYCAGKNIVISGTVEGDVLCAGQNIKVSGVVEGDVRVAAQTVVIDGRVGENVTAFAQTVDVTKSALIASDLNGAAETFTIDGKIGRDAAISGDSITATGSIGRDVDTSVTNLTINDTATVGGFVRYTSTYEASIAKDAVKGEVQFTKHQPEDSASGETASVAIASALYGMVAFVIMALAIVLVAPQLVNAVSNIGLQRFGMSLLVGALLLLVAPIIVLFLALTVVGIPLAALLGVLWIALLIASGPIFAYYLGRLLLRTRGTNAVANMMTGSLVLTVLYMIPVVNIATGLVALIIGSGMSGLYLLNHQKKPNYAVK